VISGQDKPPVSGVIEPLKEIRRALDNPFGATKNRRAGTVPGWEVTLLFDDLQRPTPAYLALDPKSWIGLKVILFQRRNKKRG